MRTREDSEEVKPSYEKPPLTFKKIVLVAFILLVSIGIPVLIQEFISRRVALNPGVSAETKSFEILSEPPDSATVGEEFMYIIRIGQFDSPRVYVQVTTKPNWLTWDADKLKLSGVPTEKYLGQNYIVIKATDTEITKEQAFTIFIEDPSEGEVEGISDNSIRVYDSEVAATNSCQRYYEELGPLGVLSEHPECEGVFYSNSKSSGSGVLGASDNLGGSTSSGFAALDASRVNGASTILGIKLTNTLKTGLIASLAVVFGGIAILLGWVAVMSLRRGLAPEVDQKKSEYILGSKKKTVQQSFTEEGTESNVIIWD